MSRWKDPARLQKEIDAQKKRAEALALLNNQGGERHYKPGEVRRAREGKDVDNTLEAVTMRRAKQAYEELSAKDRLLQQQNRVREGLQHRQSAIAVKPLAEGWREVQDPSTGQKYYWNKASNATSWERPEASADEQAPQGSSRATVADARKSGNGQPKKEVDAATPLQSPMWTEVKDPKTGGVYYWNKSEGATTWTRPAALEVGATSTSSTSTTPTLAEGWKAVTHAATGQTQYVHEATGKRSHTIPGSEAAVTVDGDRADESSSLHQSQRHAGASESRGRDARDGGRPRKKGRGDGGAIDPLDPTGKKGGKWSDGLVQVGERMADSTASGPLWQQRPYPAPGKILRGRGPSDGETAGPRPRR